MHYIAVLDNIILTLYTHLASSTDGRFCLVVDKIIVFDDFSADETFRSPYG